MQRRKKFTGKHLCQKLFFKLRPATLLKKRLWHKYFPVNFVKSLRTPFLHKNSGRCVNVSHAFKIGLKAWETNMDIKPVFNKHKATADIYAYMSRRKALKTSIEYECGKYKQMRAIAHAYSSNREWSMQEAVYRCFYKNYGCAKFCGVINICNHKYSREAF